MINPIASEGTIGEEERESDEDWSGIEDSEPPPIDHEAEYIDEDKYTTVTVEEVDVTREGLTKAEQNKDQDTGEDQETDKPQQQDAGEKRKWTKENPKGSSNKIKKKKRNFRYESKAERKVTRTKERAKGRRQARDRKAG